MTSIRAITGVALCVLLGLAVAPAAARQWQATPTSLATDYAQIIDQRTPFEFVFVMWVPPEMLEDNAQNAVAREILAEYVVIGVVHATVSRQGKFSYAQTEEIAVSVRDGAPRQPLDEDAVTPAVAGILFTVQAVMEQALGPMGEGMQWFAFDGRDISSCGEGEFWVAFADENYNYETPIPGCPGL